jgi:high-affinity Fe2+/Pb2+ permease
MELVMVLSLHYFTLGTWVLLISGILSFIFPRLKMIFIVLISMVFGYFYTMQLESLGLTIFAIILSATISLLTATLVKLGFYAKHKADELSKDDY